MEQIDAKALVKKQFYEKIGTGKEEDEGHPVAYLMVPCWTERQMTDGKEEADAVLQE